MNVATIITLAILCAAIGAAAFVTVRTWRTRRVLRAAYAEQDIRPEDFSCMLCGACAGCVREHASCVHTVASETSEGKK